MCAMISFLYKCGLQQIPPLRSMSYTFLSKTRFSGLGGGEGGGASVFLTKHSKCTVSLSAAFKVFEFLSIISPPCFPWIDSSYSKAQLWLYSRIPWPTFCCNYSKWCLWILHLHVDGNEKLAFALLSKRLTVSSKSHTHTHTPFGSSSQSGHLLFLILKVWQSKAHTGFPLCSVLASHSSS